MTHSSTKITQSLKDEKLIESPAKIQTAKVPKLELDAIMDTTSENKQNNAGQVTPAFCLQSAAEL